MMRSARLTCWQASANPVVCGIEIANLTLGNRAFEAELDRILGGLDGDPPLFVVVNPAPTAPAILAADISRSRNFRSDAHVCLAVDIQVLRSLDPALLREKNLGILLDHIDAGTPLDALGAEGVEAVRFSPDFARKASSDLRTSCIAHSMLRVAHDLGLATLGPAPRSEGVVQSPFEFDYVSRPQPR